MNNLEQIRLVSRETTGIDYKFNAVSIGFRTLFQPYNISDHSGYVFRFLSGKTAFKNVEKYNGFQYQIFILYQ
jgi:hypothetical protein